MSFQFKREINIVLCNAQRMNWNVNRWKKFLCINYCLCNVCLDLYKLDINFTEGMPGKYQSNPCFDHWKVVKKVLRYL
jgi:hypothetical protein